MDFGLKFLERANLGNDEMMDALNHVSASMGVVVPNGANFIATPQNDTTWTIALEYVARLSTVKTMRAIADELSKAVSPVSIDPDGRPNHGLSVALRATSKMLYEAASIQSESALKTMKEMATKYRE